MSKLLRVILIIIVSATLWLPNSSDAEAGWHSPNGNSLWTADLHPFCRNGLEITRVLLPFDPDSNNRDYIDLAPLSFSAFQTSMPSSDKPQIVYDEWPDDVRAYLLNSTTVSMQYHSTSFDFVDDYGQMYTTNVYKRGRLTWAHFLPVGTTVMVKLTGAPANYLIGQVTACILL